MRQESFNFETADIHPTLDQLKTLKLEGMVEAFAEIHKLDGTSNLTHAEWLGLLIDRESTVPEVADGALVQRPAQPDDQHSENRPRLRRAGS